MKPMFGNVDKNSLEEFDTFTWTVWQDLQINKWKERGMKQIYVAESSRSNQTTFQSGNCSHRLNLKMNELVKS